MNFWSILFVSNILIRMKYDFLIGQSSLTLFRMNEQWQRCEGVEWSKQIKMNDLI